MGFDKNLRKIANELQLNKEQMKNIIVFDIDGTLADISHRQGYVRQKPKRWDLFNRTMDKDSPHDDVIWLFKVLQERDDTIMIVASGRGTENRPETEEWLAKHGIVYEKLYMRPVRDHRRDSIIKLEILEQIKAEYGVPFMVFDDRDQVVHETWRFSNIRCMQVADGEF